MVTVPLERKRLLPGHRRTTRARHPSSHVRAWAHHARATHSLHPMADLLHLFELFRGENHASGLERLESRQADVGL